MVWKPHKFCKNWQNPVKVQEAIPVQSRGGGFENAALVNIIDGELPLTYVS